MSSPHIIAAADAANVDDAPFTFTSTALGASLSPQQAYAAHHQYANGCEGITAAALPTAHESVPFTLGIEVPAVQEHNSHQPSPSFYHHHTHDIDLYHCAHASEVTKSADDVFAPPSKITTPTIATAVVVPPTHMVAYSPAQPIAPIADPHACDYQQQVADAATSHHSHLIDNNAPVRHHEQPVEVEVRNNIDHNEPCQRDIIQQSVEEDCDEPLAASSAYLPSAPLSEEEGAIHAESVAQPPPSEEPCGQGVVGNAYRPPQPAIPHLPQLTENAAYVVDHMQLPKATVVGAHEAPLTTMHVVPLAPTPTTAIAPRLPSLQPSPQLPLAPPKPQQPAVVAPIIASVDIHQPPPSAAAVEIPAHHQQPPAESSLVPTPQTTTKEQPPPTAAATTAAFVATMHQLLRGSTNGSVAAASHRLLKDAAGLFFFTQPTHRGTAATSTFTAMLPSLPTAAALSLSSSLSSAAQLPPSSSHHNTFRPTSFDDLNERVRLVVQTLEDRLPMYVKACCEEKGVRCGGSGGGEPATTATPHTLLLPEVLTMAADLAKYLAAGDFSAIPTTGANDDTTNSPCSGLSIAEREELSETGKMLWNRLAILFQQHRLAAAAVGGCSGAGGSAKDTTPTSLHQSVDRLLVQHRTHSEEPSATNPHVTSYETTKAIMRSLAVALVSVGGASDDDEGCEGDDNVGAHNGHASPRNGKRQAPIPRLTEQLLLYIRTATSCVTAYETVLQSLGTRQGGNAPLLPPYLLGSAFGWLKAANHILDANPHYWALVVASGGDGASGGATRKGTHNEPSLQQERARGTLHELVSCYTLVLLASASSSSHRGHGVPQQPTAKTIAPKPTIGNHSSLLATAKDAVERCTLYMRVMCCFGLTATASKVVGSSARLPSPCVDAFTSFLDALMGTVQRITAEPPVTTVTNAKLAGGKRGRTGADDSSATTGDSVTHSPTPLDVFHVDHLQAFSHCIKDGDNSTVDCDMLDGLAALNERVLTAADAIVATMGTTTTSTTSLSPSVLLTQGLVKVIAATAAATLGIIAQKHMLMPTTNSDANTAERRFEAAADSLADPCFEGLCDAYFATPPPANGGAPLHQASSSVSPLHSLRTPFGAHLLLRAAALTILVGCHRSVSANAQAVRYLRFSHSGTADPKSLLASAEEYLQAALGFYRGVLMPLAHPTNGVFSMMMSQQGKEGGTVSVSITRTAIPFVIAAANALRRATSLKLMATATARMITTAHSPFASNEPWVPFKEALALYGGNIGTVATATSGVTNNPKPTDTTTPFAAVLFGAVQSVVGVSSEIGVVMNASSVATPANPTTIETWVAVLERCNHVLGVELGMMATTPAASTTVVKQPASPTSTILLSPSLVATLHHNDHAIFATNKRSFLLWAIDAAQTAMRVVGAHIVEAGEAPTGTVGATQTIALLRAIVTTWRIVIVASKPANKTTTSNSTSLLEPFERSQALVMHARAATALLQMVGHHPSRDAYDALPSSSARELFTDAVGSILEAALGPQRDMTRVPELVGEVAGCLVLSDDTAPQIDGGATTGSDSNPPFSTADVAARLAAIFGRCSNAIVTLVAFDLLTSYWGVVVSAGGTTCPTSCLSNGAKVAAATTTTASAAHNFHWKAAAAEAPADPTPPSSTASTTSHRCTPKCDTATIEAFTSAIVAALCDERRMTAEVLAHGGGAAINSTAATITTAAADNLPIPTALQLLASIAKRSGLTKVCIAVTRSYLKSVMMRTSAGGGGGNTTDNDGAALPSLPTVSGLMEAAAQCAEEELSLACARSNKLTKGMLTDAGTAVAAASTNRSTAVAELLAVLCDGVSAVRTLAGRANGDGGSIAARITKHSRLEGSPHDNQSGHQQSVSLYWAARSINAISNKLLACPTASREGVTGAITTATAPLLFVTTNALLNVQKCFDLLMLIWGMLKSASEAAEGINSTNDKDHRGAVCEMIIPDDGDVTAAYNHMTVDTNKKRCVVDGDSLSINNSTTMAPPTITTCQVAVATLLTQLVLGCVEHSTTATNRSTFSRKQHSGRASLLAVAASIADAALRIVQECKGASNANMMSTKRGAKNSADTRQLLLGELVCLLLSHSTQCGGRGRSATNSGHHMMVFTATLERFAAASASSHPTGDDGNASTTTTTLEAAMLLADDLAALASLARQLAEGSPQSSTVAATFVSEEDDTPNTAHSNDANTATTCNMESLEWLCIDTANRVGFGSLWNAYYSNSPTAKSAGRREKDEEEEEHAAHAVISNLCWQYRLCDTRAEQLPVAQRIAWVCLTHGMKLMGGGTPSSATTATAIKRHVAAEAFNHSVTYAHFSGLEQPSVAMHSAAGSFLDEACVAKLTHITTINDRHTQQALSLRHELLKVLVPNSSGTVSAGGPPSSAPPSVSAAFITHTLKKVWSSLQCNGGLAMVAEHLHRSGGASSAGTPGVPSTIQSFLSQCYEDVLTHAIILTAEVQASSAGGSTVALPHEYILNPTAPMDGSLRGTNNGAGRRMMPFIPTLVVGGTANAIGEATATATVAFAQLPLQVIVPQTPFAWWLLLSDMMTHAIMHCGDGCDGTSAVGGGQHTNSVVYDDVCEAINTQKEIVLATLLGV